MSNLINRIKHIVLQIVYLSPILKRTNWYKNLFIQDIYPGNNWYRNHEERNYDLVVLGSSSAKWAFDFTDSGIKAMNWAQEPQTLIEDYNILRNFHSILHKGGIVIITIMPFTSINKQTGLLDALKYAKVDSHAPIEPFLYDKAKKIAKYPILLGKPALKAMLKYMIGRDIKLRHNNHAIRHENPMNSDQLDQNAHKFIIGWKQQFNITDLEAPLTIENQKGRAVRVELLKTIIDFCIERSYKPILVIPPVTKHLSKYFTPTFENIYIYSFLKEAGRKVSILDYSKDETLQSDDLYINSFFFNQKGREIFTNRILNDLSINRL